MFHVGQKIVCIKDYNENGWQHTTGCVARPNIPVKGEIYHVREVVEFTFSHGKRGAILLREITNPVVHWTTGEHCECPFDPSDFRPLVEKKTDISIFTEMLKPKNVEEPV